MGVETLLLLKIPMIGKWRVRDVTLYEKKVSVEIDDTIWWVVLNQV